MLSFLERDNAFTLEFAYIDEGTYSALVAMAGRAVEAIFSLPVDLK